MDSSGLNGLARVLTPEGPAVVRLDGDSGSGRMALVDGSRFEDLPELLDAAGGNDARIEEGPEVTVSVEELLPVVGNPRKVVCVGLNYRSHLDEADEVMEKQHPIPDYPILFPKWASSLAGPYATIELPPESNEVDYESELAFVFGKTCRRVKAQDVADVVFGYTIANDVSMREFQMQSSQWLPGKAWDRSTSLGPTVVPIDSVGGVAADLHMTGKLNGELLQDAQTSDLIFGVAELVEYMTTFMTMEPGDVVLTGTCAGVGAAAVPPLYLKDGDVYEVEIEKLGVLRNRFVDER